MYEELGPHGLEILAVAEDTAGEEAAGPFYDAATKAAAGKTITELLDPRHTISALYGLVNVPTGIMIDEEGRVVHIAEGTYTKKYTAGTLEFGTDEYVPLLRDWVHRGAESAIAQTGPESKEQFRAQDDREARAQAAFRLGVFFHENGDAEKADSYWQTAQKLHPESWNYHRQDWSFTPAEAGPNWMRKFQALEGEDYYKPMVLPEGGTTPDVP